MTPSRGRRMVHARGVGHRRRWWRAVAGFAAVAVALVVTGLEIGPLHAAPARPVRAATLRRVTDRAAGRRLAGKHAPPPAHGAILTTHSKRLWRYRDYHLAYGGHHRSYLVVSPEGAVSHALPILVELQGCCGVVDAEAHRSAFQTVAQPAAILVYPQAWGPAHHQHWDAGACCGPAVTARVDDVGFIAAVIARVQRTVPHAASGKVYLVGYSNGGRMAFLMACDRPHLFAAVAVYAGVEAASCHRNHPPPMTLLDSVGSKDGEIRLRQDGKPIKEGAFVDPSVVQQVGYYLRADRCSAHTTVAVAGSLTETVWDCPRGRRVGIGVFAGQNHRWPQADGKTPSAQQLLWDFLAAAGA